MGKRVKKKTRAQKIAYSKAQQNNRKMVQCISAVNRDGIERVQINGIEHIVVSSYTLPDDVVMNDVLYPAAEIEAGYASLERTLAPVEHPVNANGEFISATDPEAIHNFHAGAFNMNVSRENGRVHIEKHINVHEALKTDRGKRLLDRIDELENNENPRPIHTSVGLFLTIDKCGKPRKNAAGDEYTMIGRDFVFDHDAILLDSVGAATPEQGVGMAVNEAGQRMGVDRVFVDNAVKAATGLPLAPSGRTWSKGSALKRVRAHIGAGDAPNATYGRYHLWYDAADAENFGAYKLPFVDIVDGKPHAVPAALRNAAARLGATQGPSAAEKTRIKGIIDGYLKKLKVSAEGLSYTQLYEKVYQKINDLVAATWIHITDLYPEEVIFETEVGYFSVPYSLSNGAVTIAGIPIRVDKVVEYQPKLNKAEGDKRMKSLILNALAEAGIATDGLSDDELLAAYAKLQANAEHEGEGGEGNDGDGGGDSDAIANAVTQAIKPLNDKVDALTAQVNAGADKERADLTQVIINSKKYPGIDEAAAKLLPIETLKDMAANCADAHGLPFTANDGENENFGAPAEMPE